MPLKANSLPTKDSADPMLQGTYVQDDAHDFEPSTDEIAAFEERLNHHGSGNSGVNTTAHAANPRRLSEAEQEEEIQHKEDVDDVRQLNARFGDADNDSD